MEKKNLSVRRKIFKVWRGENVSVGFRVFGKKKVPEEMFWDEILKVKDFTKFVFTSWALCWEAWLNFEIEALRCRKIFKV